MPAARVSFTIRPDLLRKFNELVPSGKRSQLIEQLIERALIERRRGLEELAEEFATHPDFAEARADSAAFEVTAADGLDPAS
jgi:metal-responsive CopG/Arc/MetJ family transcriptional regulator